MKKFSILILLSILLTMPANADIVWPSLYIAKGMLSIKVILAGFIIETLFVKYFAKTDWKKASIASAIMNVVTTLTGIILIPISGLGAELVFELVFKAYDKFGIGTFHWSHWLASFFLIVLINTVIEGFIIKFILKLKFKQTFWWLFIANTISVLICIIYYWFSAKGNINIY